MKDIELFENYQISVRNTLYVIRTLHTTTDF